MSERAKELPGELLPPQRLMLTPGPSCVDPRVYRAMAAPIVGHMDPWFTHMMDDVQELLRQVFETRNRITFPISASGSGGIEAAVANALDAGDECIVCINGAFSERMAIIAERIPAKVIRVEAPYGRTVDPQDVLRAGKGRKIKFVGLAHGETSSGVVQRIEDYRTVADELGALLVVDTVATLAGVPLHVDAQRVDICFSGSQKAISAPPGMSPITVSTRAEQALHARQEPVRSWYFDLTSAMNYWGHERLYHHTPPISLIYALREALRAALEEGLQARWERHKRNQQALVAAMEAMGLELFVSRPEDRLVTVTAINIPSGVDDARVRRQLLDEFNIEIAGGLGPIKGKIWRVGLMGYSCQETNVLLFLAALEKTLLDQGFRLSSGAGVAAALESYQQASDRATVGARKSDPMAKNAAWSRIPNVGAMSEFIGAFDVPSKVTDYVYHCRFSHCWNGIATRHSDTMDCKFFVDGKGVILGLAHPGFVKFQERTGRNLSDREASYIGAEYLRGRLEQEDEHSLYDVSAEDVLRTIEKLGIH